MTSWIAALPMYDWPERRDEVDAEWAALRDRLRAAGIDAPDALTRADDLHAQWRSPNLLLGQTCWGPMDCGIAGYVQVVGQPSYDGIEGGEGELYSSAIVMRGDDPGLTHAALSTPTPYPSPQGGGETEKSATSNQSDGKHGVGSPESPSPLRGGVRGGGMGGTRAEDSVTGGTPQPDPTGTASIPLDLLRSKRFAYNNPDSMSGLMGLTRDLEALGESLDIFAGRIETGGHRASIRAIARGEADVAAIDCRSWQMAKLYEPAARGLAVVGWTAKRPGLPFITANATPPDVVAALREALAERTA